MRYRRILVGYDGSENAKRALDRAVEVAREEKGAELRIVVVADTKGRTSFQLETPASAVRNIMVEQAKSVASDAAYIAKHAGISDVYSSVEEGQPADMILTLASEYKADLIVVGRRGIRGLQRFLMGSVSSAVIGNALTDVLVVK